MENEIEKKLVRLLKEKKYKISFAESCTGGLIVATLINASGSSSVISESYVTYSADAKMKILKVKKETLDKYSVYSKEVANEMVEGLKNITNADVCASVTGLAESDSGKCKCDYAIIIKDKKVIEDVTFTGSRNDVRTHQAKHILTRICELLEEY